MYDEDNKWQFIVAFWVILFIGLIVSIVYLFDYLSSFFGLAPYLAGIFLMGLGYYIDSLIKESREQKKVCPFCAEKIKKIAVVCKHCGKEVGDKYENSQKREEGTFETVNIYDAPIKNGKWTYWHENGQKSGEVTYKDERPNGKVTWWYENGQKEFEETYKDGELDGKRIGWFENGQKSMEETCKDGDLINMTEWYENGQKNSEGTYKDHKFDGKWTSWFENGQKRSESTYKDGEEYPLNLWDEDGDFIVKDGNGKLTYWHDNGRKECEETYKDGKKIEEIWWDWDGNEIEPPEEQ